MNIRTHLTWLLTLTCLLMGRPLAAGEIGWLESFSIGADREQALKQLIPGTEDYYYYHCLHYQHLGRWDLAASLLKEWVEKHTWTPRAVEIQNRQALLTYPQNPAAALTLIRQRLNLQFDHQREQLHQKPNLPTRLAPELLSRERLTGAANAQFPNTLQGFEDSALEWLVTTDLNSDQRRNLLARLTRPDVVQLPALIVADLNEPHSGGFGQFNIHRQLLLSQLDELLRLKPELRNHPAFVETYLVRLHPSDDANFRQDRAVRLAYLERLWAFVKTLAPVHNSLKAHVLYHRLALDRQLGKYDQGRFLEYLKLPRHAVYVEPKYMQPPEHQQYASNLRQDFPTTLFPPVGNDEPLVRDYLLHFLVAADDYSAFAPYVAEPYLKRQFAEARIVNGVGDPARWAALLTPTEYQQLKQRIDLEFAFDNRELFAADEAVSLDLHIKNVETLIVKVFEINARNFYRENLREIGTDINLDGLVPRDQQTYHYDEPSVRRVRRHFDFPALDRRGVYVIDFIGNGMASRALVRKGKLRAIGRTGVAGQVFTVFNEQKQPVPDATLWLGGRLFQPNAKGEILVPFSNQPGPQQVVLESGGFSSLQEIAHEAEAYRLDAAFYVDREELIARRKATVLVRPQLWLGNTVVTPRTGLRLPELRKQLWLGHTVATPRVLEETRLRITSTDLDGVVTTKTVSDFQLYDDRESTYEFQVPQRLASLQFALLAKVKVQSRSQDVELEATREFSLNQIDRTEKTEAPHLAQIGEEYVIDLLGKTGEAKPDRAVHLALKLRDFKQPVQVTLKTDERGRVWLGRLPGVASVTASSPQGVSQTWPIRQAAHTYASIVHGDTETAVRVPLMSAGDKLRREDISLLELRGDQFVADRFENASLDGGLITLSKLPPGDYSLVLKDSQTAIKVRITAGPIRKNYILGDHRGLELHNPRPLQVLPIEVDDQSITVRLQNASKFARVHLFATRFEPAYRAFDLLRQGVASPASFEVLRSASQYVAGRDIGDEYRYIIERRFARKFPGNMLERPGLILNPWAIRSTNTGVENLQAGGGYGRADELMEPSLERAAFGGGKASGRGDFSNLDFLAASSLVLANLAPDENGAIKIPRAELGPHQQLVVLAVDPQNTASRYVALPDARNEFLDLRLAKSLDPLQHFMQRKRISVLKAGDKLVIDDITSARFELYDTLARVYGLYAALGGGEELTEFGFVCNWSALPDAKKQELYKKYASHELHFFLARKDPEFFKKSILGYLANKRDPQFVDRWLLGRDLKSFGQPWDFAQLNTFEAILLGQRLNERENTARLIREQFELLPPDPDRFVHLFETALKGSALETGDRLGLQAAQEENAEFRLLREKSMEQGAGVAPSAPAAAQADETDGRSNKEASRSFAGRRASGLPQKVASSKRDIGAAGKSHDKLADAFFDDDTAERGRVAQFYRALDKTMELVESNYYHLPIAEQTSALISANEFWKDYAAHGVDEPFLATSLAEPTHNVHEMLMALALLDLPFEAAEHQTRFAGPRMTLTAGSPAIVYHEEIQPAAKVAENTPILVSQNFFRHGDRYRMVNGEKTDQFVTDEFLVDVVYGCHLVVTNPTSSRKKVTALLQVPAGALPVQGGQFTRSAQLDLQPYHTQTLEYYFYFPLPGNFAHYPVQVSDREAVLAFAAPFEFNVVRELTTIDKTSWDYVSQYGTDAEVLGFLKTENAQAVNLDRIAWRMRDKAFFGTTIGLLASRHLYNHTLWSYAVKHDDPAAIRQFLQFSPEFVGQCGDWLDSPLLTIDPVVRRMYEFMEYRPLVNARVGQVGRNREILNNRFFEQYLRLMKILSYKPSLDDEELMAVTYYLLLQDRVGEAIEYFGRVDASKLHERMQYDYFDAYLGFSQGEPARSKQIAARYADYPVERWRELFANIVNQATEIEGQQVAVADAKDRTQTQTVAAADSPALDFSIDAGQVRLDYQNLTEATVNYYLMDVELLFSTNPFAQQDSRQFANIVPNVVEVVHLPEKGNRHQFPIPARLSGKNLLVEIVGDGVTRSRTYYSNDLRVRLMENFGQLQVTQAKDDAPLATVYVKVYARMKGGNLQFYKDGYTDLRGRFDYTSLSTSELDNVERFALLVMSESHGATVREAAPPKQ